jgi:hypothetical protein
MAGKSSLLIDVKVCSTSELSLIVISHVRRAPVTLNHEQLSVMDSIPNGMHLPRE